MVMGLTGCAEKKMSLFEKMAPQMMAASFRRVSMDVVEDVSAWCLQSICLPARLERCLSLLESFLTAYASQLDSTYRSTGYGREAAHASG